MQKAFEKIVERLKEESYVGEYCEVVDLDDAIFRVNQVAEEYKQEVCEWEGKDMLGLYNSSCRQKSIVNPFWTYCPYCGKKIKVVE